MPSARMKQAFGLCLVLALGCATEGPTKRRVIQSSRTGGAPVAQKKPSAVPKKPVDRETELIQILASKKVRSLPVAEQALAAALAHREIAQIREKRGDYPGAEDAIERALREAKAAGDVKFVNTVTRDRFKIYRGHALLAAEKGDFSSSLRQLDKILLFQENSSEEKQTIAGDRFMINDRRAEKARETAQTKTLAMPGEEQVDVKAVLAEADRVFGPMSSFETESAGQAFLDHLTFELNASKDNDATMDIVSMPIASNGGGYPTEPSSRTRGHELAANDRVTVDIPTNGFELKPTDGTIGDHTKQEAQIVMPRAEGPLVETGKFDTRTVAALVSLNKRSVARCYDSSLRAGERLTGKLEVRITVQPSGLVSATEIAAKNFAATELGRCVAQTMGRWRFPPFAGAEAQVTIPFFLKGAF